MYFVSDLQNSVEIGNRIINFETKSMVTFEGTGIGSAGEPANAYQ